MKSELVDVTVAVPIDRRAEFYKMFGAWLDGNHTTPTTGWRNGTAWQADDETDAIRFYRSISTTARLILRFWARNAGEWMDANATADAVGVNGAKGVAGSLSSVGKAANKLGRQLPFEHEAGEAGGPGRYRMSPLVAKLFTSAGNEVSG
jgi:Family of unknown function (DUF6416)